MKKFLPVLALAFSSAAWAQTGELWFNFGESLLQNAGLGTDQISPLGGPVNGATSNDVKLTNDWRFSFRFGFNQGDHFGHEIQYAYNRTQLQYNVPEVVQGVTEPSKSGMAFHQGGYNFLYYLGTGTDRRIRPFATAGVMFDTFVPPGSSLYGGGSTKFGANFGAGVKVHIKGIWAARLDAREYVSGKPAFGFPLNSGALWQTEISAGVGVGF
jgi:opacity protein-like surface antigen